MKVAVIGMGKTGLPMAVALHKRRCEVVGVDVIKERLSQLADPTFNPAEPFCSWRDRKEIHLTSDIDEAVALSDVALMIIQTPEVTPMSGVIDLIPTREASRQIGEALRKAPKPYCVIMSSTVMPGTCKGTIAPQVGPTCSVVFNPVWIALGSVVEDYLHPPVVVLGADGPVSEIAQEFSEIVFQESSPILTDTTTAEITKLVYNVWCTLKMAFINEAATIYQAAGADAGIVEGFFKGGGERAGVFLKPGPPPGGPCFPRDLRFAHLLERGRSRFETLVEAVDSITNAALEELIRKVRLHQGRTVGIVGLTYKPGVPVLEETVSLVLAKRLAKQAYRVVGYDPLIKEGITELELMPSLEECLAQSDVVVEMHVDAVPDDVQVPVIRPWRV